MYVKHPLVKENSLEYRKYQESILETALNKNTLCVLPTGLGKTNISILLAAHMLEKYPERKILVLAPTRPLVDQHRRKFLEFLNIGEEETEMLTGLIKPSARKEMYKEKIIIFATPQTIQNDLVEKRVSLKDFSLVVLDEIHHAVGRYAYPYIAQTYLKQAENPRIVGLTASPGGTADKIHEICENCGIEAVEIRSEKDEDVQPYIKTKEIEWVDVTLPDSFMQIRNLIDETYKKKIASLRKMGFVRRKLVSKRELLSLQSLLFQSVKRSKRGFIGLSLASQAIKLEHALTLLETQSISMLENYFSRVRSENSKGNKILVNDKNISRAMHLTHGLHEQHFRHPKISRLASAVHQAFSEKPESKIIIFCNYREMVKEIVAVMEKIEGARPCFLIGQKEGLSQKEQIQVIREYELDIYNVLVTTSVGEEGLSLETADLAIFYEAVPSEIRLIQRRGRVGRTKIGKIIVLVTKNSRDEAYKWSAYHKEKRMKKTLYGMKHQPLKPLFKK